MEIHDTGFDQTDAPIHEMYSTDTDGATDYSDTYSDDTYSDGLGGSSDDGAFGAGSTDGGNPHPGEIEVNINGQHATAQENVDLNQDGTPDSVAVEADNGDVVVFTDTDGDGDADHIEVFDPSGQQIGSGTIDDEGNVARDNGGAGSDTSSGDTGYGSETAASPHPGQIEVNINGQHATAQENVDLNQDGTPDSVAVEADNGDVVVFTDTDGDGDADHIEVFDPSGQQIGSGTIDDEGNVTPDRGGAGTDTSSGDTGYGSETAANPHPGQIDINVGGRHTTAQENVDLNQDGTPDSTVVQASNGDNVVFTDTDGDGTADHVEVFDPTGQHVLAEGAIDADGNVTPVNSSTGSSTDATGGVGGSAGAGHGADSAGVGTGGDGYGGETQANPHPGQIDVNIGGHHSTAQENVDLNQDGTPDSLAVEGKNGDIVVFTDTDGDGDADRVGIYNQAGQPVATGTIDADGNVTPDDGSGGGGTERATYMVDPATGEWTASQG